MIIKFLFTAVTCLICMLAIDAIWLWSMMATYKKYIGHLMGSNVVYSAALVFYVLYAVGITIFIVSPALIEKKSLLHIFIYGALFGLVAYGTYDLTNHATLRDWPVLLTVIDMMWGGFVTGMTSVVSVYLLRWAGWV